MAKRETEGGLGFWVSIAFVVTLVVFLHTERWASGLGARPLGESVSQLLTLLAMAAIPHALLFFMLKRVHDNLRLKVLVFFAVACVPWLIVFELQMGSTNSSGGLPLFFFGGQTALQILVAYYLHRYE